MAMTPDQFTELMRAAAGGPGDAEDAHMRVDALMVDLLRSLGYGDAMDIVENMVRWYA